MKKILLLLFIVPLLFACSNDDEDNEEHIKKEFVTYLENRFGYKQIYILDFKKFDIPYEKSELFLLTPKKPDEYTNKHYYATYRFYSTGPGIRIEAGYFNENYKPIKIVKGK